jgi:microcystin-dependent protein
LAEPFLSEIRIISLEFAPKGSTLCNGQLLPIDQNQAIFRTGRTFVETGG